MNPLKILEPILFFTYQITEDLIRTAEDGAVHEQFNVAQTKKITSANWDIVKDMFIEQRLSRYSEHYTIIEKINGELKIIRAIEDELDCDRKVVLWRYRDALDELYDIHLDDWVSTETKWSTACAG